MASVAFTATSQRYRSRRCRPCGIHTRWRAFDGRFVVRVHEVVVITRVLVKLNCTSIPRREDIILLNPEAVVRETRESTL